MERLDIDPHHSHVDKHDMVDKCGWRMKQHGWLVNGCWRWGREWRGRLTIALVLTMRQAAARGVAAALGGERRGPYGGRPQPMA